MIKMQASTFTVKGNIAVEVQNRRVLPDFAEIRKTSTSARNQCLKNRGTFCRLKLGSVAMGAELARARTSVESVFRSSLKARSIRAQASGLIMSLLLPMKSHVSLFIFIVKTKLKFDLSPQ